MILTTALQLLSDPIEVIDLVRVDLSTLLPGTTLEFYTADYSYKFTVPSQGLNKNGTRVWGWSLSTQDLRFGTGPIGTRRYISPFRHFLVDSLELLVGSEINVVLP